MPLDIGVGILSALFLSRLSGVSLTLFFLGAGIIFSLLPDLDFLIAFKNSIGVNAHKHRAILHHPLIFIPLGTAAIFLFDYHLAALFAITAFLHFLHDSIGTGWGVQWLYPFSKNHYAFFYQYDVQKNNLPRKAVYFWTPVEVRQLADQYGDPHWIKNIYLKLHPYALVEFMVLVVALVALFLFGK